MRSLKLSCDAHVYEYAGICRNAYMYIHTRGNKDIRDKTNNTQALGFS